MKLQWAGFWGVFLAVSLLVVVDFIYRTRYEHVDIIVNDLLSLKNIFETIDHTCDIISFDYQKNPINFLTIKKDGFVGSELGSMNIAYPEKWDGPYLKDNPTMQGIEYQIVRTKKGYFISPGDGVTLPNGKTIGKDIILSEEADILQLMHDENGLMYQGTPCAVLLTISINQGLFQYLASENYMEG